MLQRLNFELEERKRLVEEEKALMKELEIAQEENRKVSTELLEMEKEVSDFLKVIHYIRVLYGIIC